MSISGEAIQLSSIQGFQESNLVLDQIQNMYAQHFPLKSFAYIKLAYLNIRRLFNGQYPGYMACTTRYHDFEHTLDVLLASIRIIDGAMLSGRSLDTDTVKRAMLAAIFHDVGYIQERDDKAGTGAKYTHTHVSRSISFLWKHYMEFEIREDEVESIARMIRVTDFEQNVNALHFENDEEKFASLALASADIIGQMAARTYLEKLIFLYYEFVEAGIPGYKTEFDMLRGTRPFYVKAMNRINSECPEIWDYTRTHFLHRYKAESDLYQTAIDRQMGFLDDILHDATSNFRDKLKRWNSLPSPHYSFAC